VPSHPPPSARVIRYGSRDKFELILLRDARLALEDEGRPDISVFSDEPRADELDASADQRICSELVAANAYQGRWFRSTVVRDLTSEGEFIPRREGSDNGHPYHYNVDLGTVDDEVAPRFFRTFGPETRNTSCT